MDVLGHDHVSNHHETITPPHRLQDLEKQVAVPRRAQQLTPLITARGDEVQIAGAVITMQSIRHDWCVAQRVEFDCDR